MVSIQSLFAIGAALCTTVTTAAPTTGKVHSVRGDSTVCGVEPVPGIRKPENNATITYSAEEQKNFDGATFEIIYCSGDYFKTSSINATALLKSGDSAGPGTGGMILGTALPSDEAAPAGYYGYIFNVTVYPEDGNYITGPQQLSVLEWETGYYNSYNYDLHTITINLQKAPANDSSA